MSPCRGEVEDWQICFQSSTMVQMAGNDNFIYERRLETTPHDLEVLDKRLDAACYLYNACLCESFRRLNLVRDSEEYKKSKSLPAKEKISLLSQAKKQYKFSSKSLSSYSTMLRRGCWVAEHIEANIARELGACVYQAVHQYELGEREKPRPKSNNSFFCIESLGNRQGIIWRNGHIEWLELLLKALPAKKDKHGFEYSVSDSTIKCVRLVKRIIKGQPVWYTQLVLAEKPYISNFRLLF